MAQPEFSAIGVDFGTSTSLIAQRHGLGLVEILPIGLGTTHMPSVASRTDRGYLVGEAADGLAPEQIIFSAKRAITLRRQTIHVGAHEDGPEVNADEVIFALLTELAERAARNHLPLYDQPVVRFGCPAIWDRGQRQRVLSLAANAKIPINHATLIDEPVAAGVAWLTTQYLTNPTPVAGRLLVFDMGGGTLDIAVLDVVGGLRPKVSVLASTGLPQAGDALDALITADLIESLGIDLDALPDPAKARGALRRAVRQVKINLSTRDSAAVTLPALIFGRVPALRYARERLEELFTPQLATAEQMVWHALRIARLTHVRGAGTQQAMRTPPEQLAQDVQFVLLCGGMSNMPIVRRRMRELFEHAIVFDDAGHAPEEAIVAGLADTTGYEGLSMHRPGFDVVLEWDNGQRQLPLYEAYTPLYDEHQLRLGNSRLGHQTWVDPRQVPNHGSGWLRVRSPDGVPLRLLTTTSTTPAAAAGRPDDETILVDGLSVSFGSRQILCKLYTDGRLHFSDGVGRGYDLRVAGWQPIEGADTAPPPHPVPDPPVPYPFNRD